MTEAGSQQPVEQQEGEPVQPPSPEQQLETKAKLDALHQSMRDVLKSSEDHKRELADHFAIVHQVEQTMPGLIDIGFKLCGHLKQYCEEQRIAIKRATLGTVFWTSQGEVAFDIEYDPFDISPKDPPAFIKSGFAHLTDMAKEYPPVFELIFTLGHNLAGEVKSRGVKGFRRDISFVNLHSFKANTGKQMWAFKVLDRGVLKHSARPSMQ